ncbi:MAG: dipicolinate synthase subunit DpsA [Bacillota bacterium]|nr:dipicolinate synthase subunit DpsA [Bacillota bacterium]
MKKPIHDYGFFIMGGDVRQLELSRMLKEKGCRVDSYGISTQTGKERPWKEQMADQEIVVFPIPMEDGQGNILMRLSEEKIPAGEAIMSIPRGAAVFAGFASKLLGERAARGEIALFDFNEIESFTIKNAVPSVEGAIACAVIHSPAAIHGSRCLVIGYGRIGKLLARALRNLGAHVTVAARRRESRDWAEAEGHASVDTAWMGDIFPRCGFIFNTVPERIIPFEWLHLIKRECLLMELASKPHCLDPIEAEKLGLKYRLEQGLPGRYSPRSAANIILETIERCLEDSVEGQK